MKTPRRPAFHTLLRLLLAAVLILGAAAPLLAGSIAEVKLTLPVRARLDLAGRKTIAPAG